MTDATELNETDSNINLTSWNYNNINHGINLGSILDAGFNQEP
jgi:hypothetical protein